ncbi:MULTISPECIES: CBS domain-containing protein [Streptomyces]|uniref:CBS domain-containing protein n=1 Tax=Streptomyces anthocyanicus TaxID=68174 RepID=A0ABZ1M4I3_9ACTN|nr:MULTISPECIES: CBS domain-containing protein [Streptomyces]MDX3319055.1 CBS domain-containing protein [Streptomyces sp. ME03-5684b]WSB60299.1 CBS domain-containing protein [Streptomyces anthocyanicus]WTE18016.1 CBS domain-containing protein [Streptomyces anthocyanicus]
MTPGQLQDRSVGALPLHGTVADVMDAAGPQVWYDMTVEVALSVMAAARAEHLVVCDEDARCVGLVTQARLTAVRDSSRYTDRLRLGDITDDSEPFVSPSATREEAEDAVPFGRLGLVPVVDEHGSALGVLALSR